MHGITKTIKLFLATVATVGVLNNSTSEAIPSLVFEKTRETREDILKKHQETFETFNTESTIGEYTDLLVEGASPLGKRLLVVK